MTDIVEHEGIVIRLRFDSGPVQVAGRGFVHLAVLESDTSRSDLSKLLDLKLWGKQVKGVEAFGVENQIGKNIGLLFLEKLW